MNERSLRDRVDAPAVLTRPADTDGIIWRCASLDDLAAIHGLELAVAAADHPHYTVPLEEIADDFEASFVDVEADTIVAVAPDGEILAWGMVVMPPGQESLVRSILVGAVRPSARGRGFGRLLFAWQVARGEQQLATSDKALPGWLQTFVSAGIKPAEHLFERNGLSVARYFLELSRDLAEPIGEFGLDGGLRVESFTPEWYEPTLTARNESFRDHWGSQPTSEESWASFANRSITRADLSTLAVGERDGAEEVAGFVIASVNEEDWAGQGFSSAYIDLVGVTRPWRKRGVAASLLANTLRLTKAAGLDRAVLDVDAESPTGALGLYTNLGFVESNRSMAFTRVY